MSAVTQSIPKLDAPGHVTFARVLSSEWTKLRSVRSTVWCLGIATLLTIAVPLIAAGDVSSQSNDGTQSGENPLDIALIGVYIAQLAIAVFGVLLISAEYSTGSIRSTLTAVPKRLPVLWAKVLDYAMVSLALMVPAVLITFFATQAIMSNIPELHASLSDAGTARCVLLAPVYLTMVGIFALGLGAITRNTAGGISLFAAIFFVLPPLMFALPSDWNDAIRQYLPSEAGRQIFTPEHAEHTLTPLAGGIVFAGYCALAIAIAAFLLRHRDV